MKIGQNLKNRVITVDIEGVIGLEEQTQFENHKNKIATYQKFKELIDKIPKIDECEIVVNIRSAGGVVNDAILIYEELKRLNAKITTRCYGYVASAATIIAQAATKGQREVAESALYLIHNSIGSVEGNRQELKETIDLLNVTDGTIAQIYAHRADREMSEMVELMSENGGKGRWLASKEVLEYGLADKIIAAEAKILNNVEMVGVLGLPQIPQDLIFVDNSIIAKIHKKWSEISNLFKNVTQTSSKVQAEQYIFNQTKEQVDVEKMKQMIQNSIETKTKPREDPPLDKSVMSLNGVAYREDVQQFRA